MSRRLLESGDYRLLESGADFRLIDEPADFIALASVISNTGFSASGKAFAWTESGSLVGEFVAPNVSSIEGAVAVSLVDNRVYVIGVNGDSDPALLVFDQFGALVASPAFADEDAAFGNARAVYVPYDGAVWVAIDDGTSDDGQIWEYDLNGNFVEVVVDGLRTPNSIDGIGSITHYGDVLYFLGVIAGVHDTGVYRHQISTNTALPVLIAPTGDESFELKRTVSDSISTPRLLQSMSGDGARLLQLDGTIERVYQDIGGTIKGYGIAPHTDGETFWLGDNANNLVRRIAIVTGSIVSQFSTVATAGEDSEYSLATAAPAEPEPPTPPDPDTGLIVRINGVSYGVVALSIESEQDGTHSASLELKVEPDQIGVVALDDSLSVYEDGELIFGGSVKAVEASDFGDLSEERRLYLEVDEFAELAARDMISLTIPAGTFLRDAVDLVLPSIPGVTKDPAWVDDVDLDLTEDAVFENVRPQEILEALAQNANVDRLFAIRYTKYLDYWVPGTRPAPWDLSNGDNNYGPLKTRKERRGYFNVLKTVFSISAVQGWVFFELGANATDGKYAKIGGVKYVFKSSPSDPTDVQIGATTLDTLNNFIGVAFPSNPEVVAFLHNSTTIKFTAIEAGANGNNIQVESDDPNSSWKTEGGGIVSHIMLGSDQTTRAIEVPDAAGVAAYGRYVDVFEVLHIFDDEAAATAEAEARLVITTATPVEIGYTTRKKGPIFPGHDQMVQDELNGIPVPAQSIITSVEFELVEGEITERTITAVAGLKFKGVPWRDLYNQWTIGTEARVN